MRPDVERQNIITGLERFQEVCVDGTPADCKPFSPTEPRQYVYAILIFTRARDTGLAMTQSLMIYLMPKYQWFQFYTLKLHNSKKTLGNVQLMILS